MLIVCVCVSLLECVCVSFSYRLSAAAASTLEDLKTQGRAGLEHAISQRKVSSHTCMTMDKYMSVLCSLKLALFLSLPAASRS